MIKWPKSTKIERSMNLYEYAFLAKFGRDWAYFFITGHFFQVGQSRNLYITQITEPC